MSLTKTRDELVKVKVNESRNRPGVAQRVPGGLKVIPQQTEVAQGVPGSLRPRIFLTFRHYKGGRSSAIGPGRLYLTRNPWYSFLETGSVGGTTEKIPSDTTENRSRDRSTSSAAKHV